MLQVVVAAAGFLGSIFLISAVKFMGKRMMGLSTTAACAVSCLLLGLYAYLFIVPGDDSYLVATWVPLALFILLAFASTAQCQIPWLLVAEVFPFRYDLLRTDMKTHSLPLNLSIMFSSAWLLVADAFSINYNFLTN